jgi:hypothetical protein
MSRGLPTDGGVCFCCRRRDDGLAYLRGRKLVWSCLDHIHLAEKVAHMPRKNLDLYEQEALRDAGDAAGSYLDQIGKTDLATLDEVEWVAFQRIHLDTFGKALAKRLESDEAPF